MAGRIEDYALIGDLHTAALVGRDGSIDWLCLPRFDSPSCFAALLGGEDAGRWQIAPVRGGPATRRRYHGDTLILQSEWDTPDGSARVTDCMPPRGKAATVVRVVEGLRGSVPMAVELRLRFGYGQIVPWVRHHGGAIEGITGPDAVWVHSDVPLRAKDEGTVVDFTVHAGEKVSFTLTYRPSYAKRPEPLDAQTAIHDTEKFWKSWTAGGDHTGRWPDAVRRSLILLKALTYAPTGGIVAAATTSLPESVGGARNWDYRFCWLRDSTFALQALLGTGHVDEAEAWRDWLLRAIAGDPADLQIMYGLDGARQVPESELTGLAGYERSAPVRIGNAAAGQFQLDVWGEVLDSLHLARQAGITVTDPAWDIQRALLDFLEQNWQRPDDSLWEIRGEPRHFVHSKVMAWVGFDRAVTAVEKHGLSGPVDRWRRIRAQIHADVLAKGFDAGRNTFTQSYGSPEVDAALLLIPKVGFLPAADPRVAGTVDTVMRDLIRDGLVLRYRPEAGVDGLAGTEGVFLACSFWLVDALYGVGRRAEADELFERLLALRTDVGLLSEEYDPVAKRQLGNTPQAFSLVGLVNSARLLSGLA